MNYGRLLLVPIFIIAILTASSLAVKTVTYTSDLPSEVTDWERNHTLPYFDPDLGNLISVDFTASLNATLDGKAENMGPSEVVGSYIDVDADMYVDMINKDRLPLHLKLATAPLTVSPYDGNLDYGGTSGFSSSDADSILGNIYYDDPAETAKYVGKGTFNLTAKATGISVVRGSGVWASIITTYCWSNATITYTYDECRSCISGYKIDSSTGAGLPNWNITLTNASGSLTAKTGPDGKYLFCNLQTGSYTICEEQKDGWKNTTPTCISVPLGCNDSNNNNFTNVPEIEKACNTFWANWNGNGTCLIPVCSSSWGWYLKPKIDDLKTGISSDLWAGAAGCSLSKGYNVGTVTLRLDSTGKIVTLHLDITGVNDDCDMDGWHLWISDSSLCPHKGFNKWIKGTAKDIQIDLKQVLTDKTGDGIFLAVHGVACCDRCGTDECTYH
jgi:hypothetical protein